MMFVSKANLPGSAALVLLGEKYCGALKKPLENLGLKVLAVPENKAVDPRLSSHADLSVVHTGGAGIYLAEFLKGSELEFELRRLGFKVEYPNISFGCNYPFDCAMNICCVGDNAIFCDKTASADIVEKLKQRGYKPILCNQGYTKCLISVVSENSIICSDKGISSACREKGIEVLEISQGNIELEGFEYGFIGGSSFKLSESKLVFTGLLDSHPDRYRILDFLDAKGIKPVFLTEKCIFDVGSILPIMEKQR